MTKLSQLRASLRTYYHKDEKQVIDELLFIYKDNPELSPAIRQYAYDLIHQAREKIKTADFAEAMLYKYKLTHKEGLALMCLAEALLRIPDKETARSLIEDRLTNTDWEKYFDEDNSLMMNAANFALNLTGKILEEDKGARGVKKTLKTILKKSSIPIIQEAIQRSMSILSHKFVIGETIEKALQNAIKDEKMGYTHSYDMLGEAALTTKDAQAYFESYEKAIHAIGKAARNRGEKEGPGLSVKLSALHPRYQFSQRERVLSELTERVKHLSLLAQSYEIGMTIDAEESYRLDLSLDILEKLLSYEEIAKGKGLGFVVQAYQKRCLPLIEWLEELALSRQTSLKIRLVKGAYWDSEIKLAQEQGVEDYPVFTQKSSTDLNYLACAQKLLSSTALYPMFATHNAYTIAYIKAISQNRDFEFQKLYGMGNELYRGVVKDADEKVRCRIYAPVGTHAELLPYLVRRLLENGANTSFVNQIADSSLSIESLIEAPYQKVLNSFTKRHPQIPLPAHLYGAKRLNSKGVNFNDPLQIPPFEKALEEKTWQSFTLKGLSTGKKSFSTNPFNGEKVGEVELANVHSVEEAMTRSQAAFKEWSRAPVKERAQALLSAADLLEKNLPPLIALCCREAGKTLPDSLAEVREAVDFCRYYAQQAVEQLSRPLSLPGPSGEENSLSLHARGPFVCISPWNFPLAIFLGQVTAALVAGNTVLAKPAGQTPLIASFATQLLHQAGIPENVLQLLPGEGSTVGAALANHPGIAGVALTGSLETAWSINKALAHKRGPIVPFIAETGGQNVLIADSSALPEQVVNDTLVSAFQSAGQRCSALRVIFIQEESAPRVLELLAGAMEELKLGDPAKLATDVGPVIDARAKDALNKHKATMKTAGKLLYECKLPSECHLGHFVAPAAFEIDSLKRLEKENFGPILHVIRYQKHHLPKVIEAINRTGFGLTQGLHTRLQSRIDMAYDQLSVGNMYVNRNMIGAVVGVQPFGGEGLSGTGPKAGGPHYLTRFMTERTLTVNKTAQGGNTQLLNLKDL